MHQQLMLSKTSNYVIARLYNFKHDGYHKVKCISKELGYRNNRGTRRRGCIPEVPSQGKYVSLERCGVHKAPQTPQMAHPILLVNSRHKGEIHDSTMGPLKVVTEPLHQAWGNLHNLIGGSQAIATKAYKLEESPQLNWRPQEHQQRHKAV